MLKNKNMNYKNIHLILLLFLSISMSAQERKVFEKKINNIDNYSFQEIDFFVTKKKIKLGGTLITPKTEYSKIVIIASGSGRNTRYSHSGLQKVF